MRFSFKMLVTLSLMAVVPLALSGCKPKNDTAANHDEHAGDHDHDHAEGPHGGHLIELGGADTKYQAEWTHDDQKGEVTVYLLQADGKTPVANAPEEVTIEIPGESAKTYTLSSIDPATYSLTDPTLVTALEIIVEGQEPTLTAMIGETPVTARFEEHSHEHEH